MALRSRHYVINHQPIPQKRVRLNTMNMNFYDPLAKMKVTIGIEISDQHGDEPMFSGPIAIDIVFYMKTPQRFPNGKPLIYHACRPDIDNLEKYVLDLCKGILFEDDRFVCKLSSLKKYDDNPRTEFTITEVSQNVDKEKQKIK